MVQAYRVLSDDKLRSVRRTKKVKNACQFIYDALNSGESGNLRGELCWRQTPTCARGSTSSWRMSLTVGARSAGTEFCSDFRRFCPVFALVVKFLKNLMRWTFLIPNRIHRCGGEFNLDAGEADGNGVVIIVDCDTCSLAVEVRLEIPT